MSCVCTGHCSLVFLVASLRGAAVNANASPLAEHPLLTATIGDAREGCCQPKSFFDERRATVGGDCGQPARSPSVVSPVSRPDARRTLVATQPIRTHSLTGFPGTHNVGVIPAVHGVSDGHAGRLGDQHMACTMYLVRTASLPRRLPGRRKGSHWASVCRGVAWRSGVCRGGRA